MRPMPGLCLPPGTATHTCGGPRRGRVAAGGYSAGSLLPGRQDRARQARYDRKSGARTPPTPEQLLENARRTSEESFGFGNLDTLARRIDTLHTWKQRFDAAANPVARRHVEAEYTEWLPEWLQKLPVADRLRLLPVPSTIWLVEDIVDRHGDHPGGHRGVCCEHDLDGNGAMDRRR